MPKLGSGRTKVRTLGPQLFPPHQKRGEEAAEVERILRGVKLKVEINN